MNLGIEGIIIILSGVLLASFIVRIKPFLVILFFICWLPVQNLILMCLSGFMNLPDEIIRSGAILKEVFALVTVSYIIVSRKLKVSRFRSIDYAMIAYFLWTSFYLLLPNSFFPVSSEIIGRLMSYRAAMIPVGLYFIGRFITFNEKYLLFSIRLLLLVSVIVSIFGIVERFLIPDSFWIKANISHYRMLIGNPCPRDIPGNFYGIYAGQYIRRVVSTYCDPLAFGFANIFIIPLGWYFVFRKRTEVLKSPLSKLFFFMIMGIAQLFTITRAAILANLLSLGLLFLYLRKIRTRIILISVTTLLFFLPLMIYSGPLLIQGLQQTIILSDPSSQGHIRALYFGAKNIISHPMGFGLGQGGYVGNVFGKSLGGESLYFTTAVERGVVGLFLLGLVIILLVNFCHKNIKYLEDDPILKGLIYIIIVSTAGYALASFTTEHWQAFVSSGIYWIYAGIAVQIIEKFQRRKT